MDRRIVYCYYYYSHVVYSHERLPQTFAPQPQSLPLTYKNLDNNNMANLHPIKSHSQAAKSTSPLFVPIFRIQRMASRPSLRARSLWDLPRRFRTLFLLVVLRRTHSNRSEVRLHCGQPLLGVEDEEESQRLPLVVTVPGKFLGCNVGRSEKKNSSR